MSIKLNELKVCMNKIISYIEKSCADEIDPKQEMYWYIPPEACYDPYKDPSIKDLTLGQISFDIDELKKIATGEAEVTAYHLIWLSTVLRAIGDGMLNK
jgi:hypothetical protein